MNVKTLGIVFVILLAVLLVTRTTDDQSDSTFDKHIVQVDTALVDKIELDLAVNDGPVTLSRTGDAWELASTHFNGPADNKSVRNLLNEISKVEAQRIVAKSEEKWKKYQVGDSLGKHIIIYQDGEKVSDLFIGKFSYSQTTQQPASFVRVAGDDRVYGVPGMISMTVGSDANSFRSKVVLKGNVAGYTNIKIQQGDSTVQLIKQGESWVSSSMAVDSSAIAAYVQKLGNVNHYQFNDLANVDNLPLHGSLSVSGNNKSPVEVKAYVVDSTTYIVTSTQNPKTQFESNQFLIDKLFSL